MAFPGSRVSLTSCASTLVITPHLSPAFKNLKVQDLEGDESLYREMRDRYGMYFKGDMGAAAIKKRLEDFDLKTEYDKLTDIAENGKGAKKTRAIKRLKVVNSFLNTSNAPASMLIFEFLTLLLLILREKQVKQ